MGKNRVKNIAVRLQKLRQRKRLSQQQSGISRKVERLRFRDLPTTQPVVSDSFCFKKQPDAVKIMGLLPMSARCIEIHKNSRLPKPKKQRGQEN
jgi:hypothetical protein